LNTYLEKKVDKLMAQLKKDITDHEEKKAESEILKSELQIKNILNEDLEKKVDKLMAQHEKAITDHEEKKAESEVLKSELQKEKIFNADLEKKVDKLRAQLEKLKNAITDLEGVQVFCHKILNEKANADIEMKKAEIKQLKAAIGCLTNELKNAKATINIEFEDKECKCSVTKILNADLEKKVDKLRAQLEKANTDPAEKKAEIEQLKATISRLTNELKNAKATINIEFEDKECKCSVTKILNADLENKVDKLKGHLELREMEIRALTERKIELINSE
jgi:chromosome segregation ATPase